MEAKFNENERDEDDLDLGELDDPTDGAEIKRPVKSDKDSKADHSAEPSISKKKNISFDQPPPEKSAGRRSTITETAGRSTFDYCKIFVLIVIWCLTVYLLMTSKADSEAPRLIAISANSVKDVVILANNVGSRLGVTIKGPFVVQNEILTRPEDKNPPHTLKVEVLRQHYDPKLVTNNEKLNISKNWILRLVPKEELMSAPSEMKDFVFDLKDTRSKYNNSKLMLRLTSNIDNAITVKVWYDPSPINKQKGILYGTIVLIFLYVMIIWEIINRTFASIIASSLAIGILSALNTRPTLGTVMSWIDVETLMLLFAMMILVAILSNSGVFDYMAVFAYEITKGRIWPLINTLCFFVAVLSPFLDNVTMMLLLTPVTIRLCEVTSVNPVPILMCMVLFANIGAALTPVGDPPNIIITNNPVIAKTNVNFANFFIHMLPGVLIGALLVYIYLRWYYRDSSKFRFKDSPEVESIRREIHAWIRAAEGISAYSKDEALIRNAILMKAEHLKTRMRKALEKQEAPPPAVFEETLKKLKKDYPLRDKGLLIKAAVTFCFVIAIFFLHSVPNFHHLTMGWTALLGALLLLILADVEDMEAILERIEWSTLLFFASLFILMEALSEMGVIDVIGSFVVELVLMVKPELRLAMAILIVLWVTAIASAFLDNIPVTTMMVKIIISLSDNQELELPLHPLVWALAFGACFGGNGTIIGASANVVSAGVIEQHGYKFTFVDFFIVGFPVMLVSIVAVTGYLLLAHVVFSWH